MTQSPTELYAEFSYYKPLKKDSIQIVFEIDKSFEPILRDVFPSCQGDGAHFKIMADDR